MRIAIAGCAAALALAASPAAAEVVTQSETGFVVRDAVEVATTPAEAWAAMIAPNRWWSSEHTFSGDAANLWLDAQAGGCFCEKLPAAKDAPPAARPGSVQHMRVLYAAPGQVLRLGGALGPLQSEALSGSLTITFKPAKGGTRILWEYVVGGYMRFKPEQIVPAVDKVLSEQLARLAAQLAPPAESEAKPKPDAKE